MFGVMIKYYVEKREGRGLKIESGSGETAILLASVRS
jgi:hypothetical protein